MKSAMDAVRAFHSKYNVPIGTSFNDRDRRRLRVSLLVEEFNEYLEGEQANDKVAIADGLADMVYIICGTALEYDIPLALIFEEVQRSNMTKNPPQNREDGKILKGPDFEPPRIREIMDAFDAKKIR
jgi:NTP pyrophosphatase (non-canonical NTP hydrolase)